MIDKLLGDLMKSKMGSGLSIKIEVEPQDQQKDDEELKKQGLAPSFPKKDKEVKKLPDDMEPEVADELMSPEEQEQMVMMSEQGEKPKGLMGKAEQVMALKKIEKNTKDGKA